MRREHAPATSGGGVFAVPLVEGARVRVRHRDGTEHMSRIERVRTIDGTSQIVVLRKVDTSEERRGSVTVNIHPVDMLAVARSEGYHAGLRDGQQMRR